MLHLRSLALTFLTALVISVALAPQPAAAGLLFTFTSDHCSNPGCGTAPFGTVKLEQHIDPITLVLDPDSVDVTVKLNFGDKFVSTGGPHQTFAFNIVNDPGIVISNLTTNFKVEGTTDGTTDKDVSGSGYFPYRIDWLLGTGIHGSPGPLTFTVTEPGHTLNPNDFIAALDKQSCVAGVCKPTGA